MIEPCGGDDLPAFYAMAEFAFVYSGQRSVDCGALRLAPAGLGKRHGLHLHRVDPRKPSDALLVQGYRRAVCLCQ